MKSFPRDLLGSSRLILLAMAVFAWLCKGVPNFMQGAPEIVVDMADYCGEFAPRLLAGSATVAGVIHLRGVERWQSLIIPLTLLLALFGLHLRAINAPNDVGQLEDLATTVLTLAFPFAVLIPLARRGPGWIGSFVVSALCFGIGLAMAFTRPNRAASYLSSGLGLPPTGIYAPLAVAILAALLPLALSRRYGLTVAIATFASALLPPLWGDGVRLAICVIGMALSSAPTI